MKYSLSDKGLATQFCCKHFQSCTVFRSEPKKVKTFDSFALLVFLPAFNRVLYKFSEEDVILSGEQAIKRLTQSKTFKINITLAQVL